MKREELEHVLRAAAEITNEHWYRLFGLTRLQDRGRGFDFGQHPIDRLVAWAQRRAQEAQP